MLCSPHGLNLYLPTISWLSLPRFQRPAGQARRLHLEFTGLDHPSPEPLCSGAVLSSLPRSGLGRGAHSSCRCRSCQCCWSPSPRCPFPTSTSVHPSPRPDLQSVSVLGRVSVSERRRNKEPHTRGCEQQKRVFLQFWRPEVPDRGIGGAGVS